MVVVHCMPLKEVEEWRLNKWTVINASEESNEDRLVEGRSWIGSLVDGIDDDVASHSTQVVGQVK